MGGTITVFLIAIQRGEVSCKNQHLQVQIY